MLNLESTLFDFVNTLLIQDHLSSKGSQVFCFCENLSPSYSIIAYSCVIICRISVALLANFAFRTYLCVSYVFMVPTLYSAAGASLNLGFACPNNRIPMKLMVLEDPVMYPDCLMISIQNLLF